MAIDADPPTTAEPATSKWLAGVYEPVADELDVADLEVAGELPAGLRGAYLRNGPNQAFPPIGAHHLFDGDGMVHGLYLADGKARYRNRWIESKGLLAERRRGKACFGGLGQWVVPDPDVVEEAGGMKNTANTHVVRHAGRILALMEACPPTELSAELETLGEHDFDGRLQGAMTAHPKVDPATGEMLFFGYSPFPPYLRFHVADASGALVRSVDLDLPAPVMQHDFAVTATHAVFFDLPATFDLTRWMQGGSSVAWEPERGARIGVLPRDGDATAVRWIEVEPFYVFHFLDAWDSPDGTEITVLGCRADRLPIGFDDDEMADTSAASLHRWHIDLTSGTVRDEPVDDRPGDFPRIDDRRAGLGARYGYVSVTSEWAPGDVAFDGIAKYDLERDEVAVHHVGPGRRCGEAVFAPDPDGTAEDDGWLLDLVIDDATRATELWVLDARDVTADPIAKVQLPRRVPVGFHGSWLPEPA